MQVTNKYKIILLVLIIYIEIIDLYADDFSSIAMRDKDVQEILVEKSIMPYEIDNAIDFLCKSIIFYLKSKNKINVIKIERIPLYHYDIYANRIMKNLLESGIKIKSPYELELRKYIKNLQQKKLCKSCYKLINVDFNYFLDFSVDSKFDVDGNNRLYVFVTIKLYDKVLKKKVWQRQLNLKVVNTIK